MRLTLSNRVEFSTELLCAVTARPVNRFLFIGMVALPVGSHVSLWREEKQKAKPLSPLHFHPATLR